MTQTQREQLEGMMRRPIPRKKVGIVKLQVVKEGRALYGMKQFTTPKEIVEMIKPLMDKSDREMMIVVSLDGNNSPVGIEIAVVGGVSECSIDMKNILKFPLLSNASSILLIHNHPSGNINESDEDITFTKRVYEAARLVGLKLLDHIIVGDDGKYKSLRCTEDDRNHALADLMTAEERNRQIWREEHLYQL